MSVAGLSEASSTASVDLRQPGNPDAHEAAAADPHGPAQGVRMHGHHIIPGAWRRTAYEVLEQDRVDNPVAAGVRFAIIGVVVASLVSVTLESVPRYAAAYGWLFDAVELVTLVVLTLELGFRLWVSVEHPLYRHLRPNAARARFLVS